MTSRLEKASNRSRSVVHRIVNLLCKTHLVLDWPKRHLECPQRIQQQIQLPDGSRYGNAKTKGLDCSSKWLVRTLLSTCYMEATCLKSDSDIVPGNPSANGITTNGIFIVVSVHTSTSHHGEYMLSVKGSWVRGTSYKCQSLHRVNGRDEDHPRRVREARALWSCSLARSKHYPQAWCLEQLEPRWEFVSELEHRVTHMRRHWW